MGLLEAICHSFGGTAKAAGGTERTVQVRGTACTVGARLCRDV